MKAVSKFILTFAALLMAATFLFTACGKRELAVTTGTVVQPAQLVGFKGDAAYSVVRSDALPVIYQDFRDELSRLGLVRWDVRFDCNKFATLYISVAQVKFAVLAWQSDTPAQSLALAEVWYVQSTGGRHAIVEALTERGEVFIDPQNGLELTLSTAEKDSIYLRKW